MRFLIDECCPRLFAQVLRSAGHDVIHIAEMDSRASDEMIVARAMEEGRVIITADYDFGELAVRYRMPVPGVLTITQ